MRVIFIGEKNIKKCLNVKNAHADIYRPKIIIFFNFEIDEEEIEWTKVKTIMLLWRNDWFQCFKSKGWRNKNGKCNGNKKFPLRKKTFKKKKKRVTEIQSKWHKKLKY